jgi:hypothetical protein
MDNTINQELATRQKAHQQMKIFLFSILSLGGMLAGSLIALAIVLSSNNWSDLPGGVGTILIVIVSWFAFPLLGSVHS